MFFVMIDSVHVYLPPSTTSKRWDSDSLRSRAESVFTRPCTNHCLLHRASIAREGARGGERTQNDTKRKPSLSRHFACSPGQRLGSSRAHNPKVAGSGPGVRAR